MEIIDGGITAPKNYIASGVCCKIKKNDKKDLALIVSKSKAICCGVFTKNNVKGNSLKLTMEHLKEGYSRAFLINSGNANACNGETGYKNAHTICNSLSKLIGCKKSEIVFNSTGVIGYNLPMNNLLPGLETAYKSLSEKGSDDAARAIMTTDTKKKEIAVSINIHGSTIKIGGIAKGSGMIHPNMATMISLLTTDANISRPLLQTSLKKICDKTFNRTSVDGDTSVCDMVAIMANGHETSKEIEPETHEYLKFMSALDYVCSYLAKEIARDGEGATKLLEIKVDNAKTSEDAYKVVSSVAKSPLVKTAFFGEDANWGRIITAIGYSNAYIREDLIDIYIGDMLFCKKGQGQSFNEEEALKILKNNEIQISIDLHVGSYSDRIWTCDFSYDYVKINGDYRT